MVLGLVTRRMQVVVCRAHVMVAAEDYFLVMAAVVLLVAEVETQAELATVEMVELVSPERPAHQASQDQLVVLAVLVEMQPPEKQVTVALVVLAVLAIQVELELLLLSQLLELTAALAA